MHLSDVRTAVQDFEAKLEEIAEQQQQQPQPQQQQSQMQPQQGQQSEEQDSESGAEGGEPDWEVCTCLKEHPPLLQTNCSHLRIWCVSVLVLAVTEHHICCASAAL